MFTSPDYVAREKEHVEAGRSIADMTARLEMLRSFGFTCKMERHCGFWLIHWKFPALKLVSGHALKK
ncbi:hypothetical protein D3C87_725590 [compost metagenome]